MTVKQESTPNHVKNNLIKTQAVRHTYRRAIELPDGTYAPMTGYKPNDQLGHAVLDTVSGLCDALDMAIDILKTNRQPGDGPECLCRSCQFVTDHDGW